ncbi:alpha/beta fold hydrolase [Pseudoalteromonas phenolica]|uniref:alpha/beta fold hydrolase n=1 Tax=Pseudoalteromonas phenolica TaxID=161398 RepID=UPI00110A2647|nr:alpha/beta hydrolase [Pseudoalteromonas phenolica]TMO57198.1 alpha/beta hydrolase [Pseudoalteromonas phenolica]
MSKFVHRIKSNKVLFTFLLILCIYILLRLIAFIQHQTIKLPGQYFSYKNKQVRYLCKGNDAPFVFFETGFAADSEQSWDIITKALPNDFTSCYYDRLGHGGSDNVPVTFTTNEKSALQTALIKHIAGNKPVVLVAHSYGGIISRRTAAKNEINLAALILLDSAHEYQHEIMRGKFDPIPDSVKNLQYLNAAFGLSDIKNIFKHYDSPMQKRLDQYYGSFRYAHVLSSYRHEKGFYTPLEKFDYDFGNLKMLVISHDKQAYAKNPRFFSMTEQWQDMQKSIAALSNNSEHIIATGATHNIPADAPDLVIKKIRETVELAKNQSINSL